MTQARIKTFFLSMTPVFRPTIIKLDSFQFTSFFNLEPTGVKQVQALQGRLAIEVFILIRKVLLSGLPPQTSPTFRRKPAEQNRSE